MRRILPILLITAILLPSLPLKAKEIDLSCKEKLIALTFDDGPHPGHTGRILDVLAQYGIKATFFIIGCNAKYYPEPLNRAIAEGHEIENHSMDHKTRDRSREELEREILDAADFIETLSGRRSSYFRPPEGNYSPVMQEILEQYGLEPVFWTIDSADWTGKPPDQIVPSILKAVRGNDIILFHDYTCPKDNTVRSLRILIPELIHRGYRFVTVEELYRRRGCASDP